MHEAAGALEVIAVGYEEIRRFLRLAERLHAVLPHFESEACGGVVDALLDQLADPPQQLCTGFHRSLLPRRPGAVRGAQRAIRIRRARGREGADELVTVG